MGQLGTRKHGSTWEWSSEGIKIDGRRNPISHNRYRTETETITADTQAKIEYGSVGRRFIPSDISISDYLDYQYDNYIRTNPSYNIQKDYERKIRVYLEPAFEKYRLVSSETDVIQGWIDGMKRRGYSKSIVKNTLSCLSSTLGCAVYPCKYIKYGPRDYTRVPRIIMSNEAKAHAGYTYVKEDLVTIIRHSGPDGSFYVPLMTRYHCDMCLGEAYGIDLLYDINFERHTITIQRQPTNKGGRWYHRSLKYDSVRTIKILPKYEKILKTRIHNRRKNMFQYGQYFTETYQMDDGLIFQAPSNIKIIGKEVVSVSVKENSGLLTPHSFKYCIEVIHEELGNPLFHNHCLRHTYDTLLTESSTQPKTVMERLSRKDIKTTMGRYVFNIEKMQSDAIIILAGTIS